MEKKQRTPISITELDVEPISDQELEIINGAVEQDIIYPISYCGCDFSSGCCG
jgi:hypothetical protein